MFELKDTPKRLVENGKVVEWGFFKTPFRDLNLLDIKIPGLPAFLNNFRLKEWQHYALIGGDFVLTFFFINGKYMSVSFCYFLDRNTGAFTEHHKNVPGGAARLTWDLFNGDCRFVTGNYRMEFDNRLSEGKHRARINIKGTKKKPGITAEIEMLEDLNKIQPLVSVVPIGENRPMYTHKAAVPVRGEITYGDRRISLNEKRDIILIDIQKTYYPFNTWWQWAAFAGYDKKGRLLALNLVKNMTTTDEEAYNENCLWVDGRLSKLSAVRFDFDAKDVTRPWKIETTDGKCKLEMRPMGERKGYINLGILVDDYHQPFGPFSGTIVDSEGVSYKIEDFFGVTEHHRARF